jgi:hypothetical protein
MLSATKSRFAGKTFLQILIFFLLVTQICFAQWVKTNGPEYFIIYDLAVSGSNLFAAAELNDDPWDYGIFLSTNQGADWIELNNGLPDDRCYALATYDDEDGIIVYAGFIGGEGVFLSADSGAHWSAINDGLPFDTISHSYPPISCLIVMDTDLFAGTWSSGVFRSTNNGATWLPTGISSQEWIAAFATDSINLIAGSNEMGLYGGVFLTTDNGTSWTNLLNIAVVDIAVRGDNILAIQQIGYWGRIQWKMHRSRDYGETWNEINSALVYRGCLLENEKHFFYGNGWGEVFVSSDFGTTWENVDSGLTTPYNHINSLVSDNTYLFAGTQDGVWRRPLSEMITDVEDTQQLPTKFSLSQNYPNPFNPSTTIKYSIPQLSNVVIKVFDVIGKEIKPLVNDEKPVGTYEVNWNAANLPSGVYFYQMKAGQFISTKKMLLLK